MATTLSEQIDRITDVGADDIVYLVHEQGKDVSHAVAIVSERTCLGKAGMTTAKAMAITKLENQQRYRVWVQADSSGTWASNAHAFDSESAASDYAHDLYCRWTAVRAYRVCPLGVNPNTEASDQN